MDDPLPTALKDVLKLFYKYSSVPKTKHPKPGKRRKPNFCVFGFQTEQDVRKEGFAPRHLIYVVLGVI